MRPTIRLVAMPDDTGFAPLGVLGYCLMRTSFLSPVLRAVTVPIKTVQHLPAAKLVDVLISILAGCRAVSQVNTRLRPDLALAHAWGRPQFAAQATLARTLDSFTDADVCQLRQGCDALFRRESRTFHHSFADDWLWLDIDLTPLPASKHAQASTKGKIGPKKTLMAGNWLACMRHSITRPSSRDCTLAIGRVTRPISRSCRHSPRSWASQMRRRHVPSCVRTPALGAIATSTQPCATTGRSSPRVVVDGVLQRSSGRYRTRLGWSCDQTTAGWQLPPHQFNWPVQCSGWRCGGVPNEATLNRRW